MLVKRNLLEKYFQISENNGLLELRYPGGINSISIDPEFRLNEDCASLAGLMPDGSLIKDLRRIYFHQKKDIRKIYLFKNIILKLFRPNNKIFIRDNRGTIDVYTNSRTLAMFFYKILKIPKSDEQMRVPNWIFKSPKKVKIAYLKQAFDMEATINKGLSDIRFITKDCNFAVDIKRLLKQVDVKSFVKDRIGGTYNTLQYQVCIYKKENFSKFKKIGFSIKFNRDRFQKMVRKYNL